MRNEGKTGKALAALLGRYRELSEDAPLTREELEERLHGEVWRGDWDEVLRLLEQFPGNVSREAAGECLCRAVEGAPPEVFEKLLDRLPRGEYAGSWDFPAPWAPNGSARRRYRWEIRVQGTLVLLAAAENRPEHLAALLARGYDVNSASPAAASALMEKFEAGIVLFGSDFSPFQPFTARPVSSLWLQRHNDEPEDIPPLQIDGATPLAAAVLFGSRACARLLVKHGAWLLESPGVSQAMWLAWRERNVDYRAAREEVLARSREKPVLWALGRTCSPHQLHEVLETWTYSREELSAAARRMLMDFQEQSRLWKEPKRGWEDLCHRLRQVGRACPEALCGRDVIGELLARCAREKAWGLEPFLSILEGQTLDLSCLPCSTIWTGTQEGKNLLETLSAHCTCVMDRDGVLPGRNEAVLRLLIKRVTFLPPAVDGGVSNLTYAILQTGNPRLIRQALRQGTIPPAETTAELLDCQRQLQLPPICRALLLTVPRPGLPDPPKARRVEDWGPRRWFAEQVPPDVTALLEEGDWDRWFYPLLYEGNHICRVSAVGECWEAHRIFTALCMLGETDVAARWLTYLPEDPRHLDSVFCQRRQLQLMMTPLCAAALTGRTETVRLLLDHGAWAAEERCGYPSLWLLLRQEDDVRPRPFLPLAAALLGKHWETAQLLLDHGAACNLRGPEVRELWHQFHEDTPETAVAPFLGAYLSGEGILRKEEEER